MFPDPINGRYWYLSAPFGPGVYELRRRSSGELILFGKSKNVAHRMTSLLPRPFGSGGRKNTAKRDYVFDHLADIEYRTKYCLDELAAHAEERRLKNDGTYLFPT